MKPHTLYLSYTGLMEPLGRSQVLAYLSRLSKDFTVTLVTFEKPVDFNNAAERASLKAECESYGITWLPRVYHKTPRLLATSWDLLMLLWDTWRLGRKGRAELIHCRSYIPAIAAWLMGKITGTPFIFDMRALWPEEMIDAGTLERKSTTYRVLNWLERRLLRDAAAVVSLTQAAVYYLKEKYPETRNQHYEVISTCVDLERFNAVRHQPPTQITVGTMGTVVSGWYHLDWLFGLYAQAAQKSPKTQLKIVSRDDRSIISKIASSSGVNPQDIIFDTAKPVEVAGKIADLSFGVLFFTAGVSKLGSAPTRMGEFLACGIPVIGNRGVGDMADLIEKYDVGVVVEDGSKLSLENGYRKILDMLSDPDLQSRCRAAAEDYFSADGGAEKYKLIYQKNIKQLPDRILP